MNYGKNQLALIKFLEKHPNRWHRIKRRRAIDAAIKMSNKKNSCVSFLFGPLTDWFYVKLEMPQMLIDQN